MEKLSSFQINSMEISGFKCFEEPISIMFGEITNVIGSNHVGKSSIADAIAFAVTGTTFTGENRIDRMYNEQKQAIDIKMDFTDQNGARHRLSRSRKNDKMMVTLDGYKVTQAQLNEIFGDRDTFLSIFNPLYFIEVLGEEGQHLLEQHLPYVEPETVIRELSELNQSLLKDQPLLSPESYMAKLREDIRGLNDAITGYEGQSTLLIQQRRQSSESLTALRMSRDDTEMKIAKLTCARNEGLDLKGLEEKSTQLHLRYDELLSDRPEMPDTSSLDKSIDKAAETLERLNRDVYNSKFQDEIQKIRSELAAAYQKYDEIRDTGAQFKAGRPCPMCSRMITDEVAAALRAPLKKKMDAIVSGGRSLKEQLEELEQLEKQAKDKWEQFRADDAKKAGKAIEDMQRQRKKLLEQYQSDQSDFERQKEELLSQIKQTDELISLGNLTPEQYQQLQSLEEDLQQINADYAAQEAVYNQLVDKTDEKIKSAKEQISKKKLLLVAAADYAAKRAEMTFENLSSGPVRIKLYEVLKTTGEVKDVFRFTYNDRDYRRLSRSEKMLAGIQVSEMVKRLTGRNFPVFIDDAESVANLSRPSGQAIVSRVVANAPLTVRPVIQEVPLKKAG